MNKKIYLGLAAAAMLTACSQEEVVDMNMDGDKINVGAGVEATSRAANSYCNEVLPETFNLTAVFPETGVTTPHIYFLDDVMRKNGPSQAKAIDSTDKTPTTFNGQTYSFANGDRYWTESNLDFFAWHSTRPEAVNFTLSTNTENNTTEAKFEDFTVQDVVSEQEDLIYATNYQAATRKGVWLQFHHALCQVVFNAMVENPNIDVAIKEVGLYGIYNNGTFTWPTVGDLAIIQAEKDAAKENGESMVVEAEEGAEPTFTPLTGGWQLGNNTRKNYFVDVTKDGNAVEITHSPIKDESGKDVRVATILTQAPKDHVNGDWSKVMQLLPQRSFNTKYGLAQAGQGSLAQGNQNPGGVLDLLAKPARRAMSIVNNTSAVIPNGRFNVPVHGENETAYIMVCCDITTQDKEGNKVTLWSSTNEAGEKKYAYIPVAIYWQPGYRYVYTINFSVNGNGGQDKPTPDPDPENPDPDPEDPDQPQPVLGNIFITIGVDEYNEVGNHVNADSNNNGGNTPGTGNNQGVDSELH